jgi:hypothetical protein
MSDDIGMDRLSKTRADEQLSATVRSSRDRQKRSQIDEEAEEKRRRRRRDQVELSGEEEADEEETAEQEQDSDDSAEEDDKPRDGGIDVTV